MILERVHSGYFARMKFMVMGDMEHNCNIIGA